jgi:hypothetical protein
VLSQNYDRIVADYAEMDIKQFGVERFFASFDYTPARMVARKGFQLFRPASLPETLALAPRAITP